MVAEDPSQGASRPARGSLQGLLARLLILVALIPFLPLAWMTWSGYRSEARRVESQIQESNRHIARLAAGNLDALLSQADSAARLAPAGDGLPPAVRGVRWERIDGDGVVVRSTVEPGRSGRDSGYAARLAPTLDAGVTEVRRWLEALPPTALVWRRDPLGGAVVGALDPAALHDALLAWSTVGLDRHVYVVDGSGSLLVYSDLAVSGRGDDLRSNPPIELFLGGGEGPLRYRSVVSGRARLGWVERLAEAPWAVVVSADPAGRLLDLRGRTVQLALSIGFAAAVALALVAWASRRIVTPLLDLRAAIAASDLRPGEPLRVRPASRALAEVDELVSAFDDLGRRFATTEGELVQAEKTTLLGQLASGVAHEMGTPLNVITGNVQYVLRSTPEESAARPLLVQVLGQAERIAAMIRRLLDFSRPAEARLAPVDLEEVVRASLQLVPDLERNVRVEVVAPGGMPPALADRRLMEHVLVNLFVNALQAMPAGGELRVVLGSEPGWVLLEVADTGCGIPPEHLEKVLQPFFTTKAQGQGTGLGLAIVDRIVRQHGGRIELRSRVGEGTTVTVRVRRADAGGER